MGNSESSRSHLIVCMKIVGVNRDTHEQLKGKILMCDLAGSERLKKSEVTGDMQKGGHIPYKNHKLTQVMQDALGGSSKTLMFVNLSPASSNADESIMALKYATRAKKVTNSVAKK